MNTFLLGFCVGLGLVVFTYELLVLRAIRREIRRCERSLRRAQIFVPVSPVKSDLSDSSPSLHV